MKTRRTGFFLLAGANSRNSEKALIGWHFHEARDGLLARCRNISLAVLSSAPELRLIYDQPSPRTYDVGIVSGTSSKRRSRFLRSRGQAAGKNNMKQVE